MRLQRDYDPSLPEFPGDADRLIQAVWNLVRNAIEAGAASVTLRTRVEHGVRIGDLCMRWRCGWRSPTTARGVPEELAEHLFLPLVSGRAEGSGLGLALAQQVAREHRGALSYRSRPGHTVFTLLLPLPEEHRIRGAAPCPLIPSPSRPRGAERAAHLGGRRRPLGALRAGHRAARCRLRGRRFRRRRVGPATRSIRATPGPAVHRRAHARRRWPGAAGQAEAARTRSCR